MEKHKFIFAQTNRDSFDAVKTGKKKIETRAATDRYRTIQSGEIIVFKCGSDLFEKQIKTVEHFDSIQDLLKKYRPEEINPRIKTEEGLFALYYSFPDYKEKIANHGLMAFTLE